ncbi:excalibur calcium-binding domain-containing protein [Agrilutibacter solisilvae]|uniref:Excalibur calcium-binding domain-containing protein n=1 Tax=Agrilutibacter solisilvae TaxID=2763317 RepID=A0A974XYV1_9GAMM|nr:excalibur calcium-binding domain-containing protein [Lysobacter solisilvae]QSX77418.1 excalibur calcium-binding domain-containing protein [Lysobacter solisilvae]
MRSLLVLAILGGLIWFGYTRHLSEAASLAPDPVRASASASPVPAAGAFACDGRTHCSQMRSCEEATYFIQHCPNTKMDGNHDGVPCERQWCD